MRTHTSHPLRALGATLALAALTLSLGACAPTTPKGPALTPHEERDITVDFVVKSTQQLDISPWHARIVAAVQGCGKDQEGASYGYDLWAPEGTDREADAKLVADHWKSLGMDVRIVTTTDWPSVYGSGGPVLRASFVTDAIENSYQIGATSWCQPGDAIALKRDASRRRAAGEVLPGDEYFIPDPGIEPVYPPSHPPTPAAKPE